MIRNGQPKTILTADQAREIYLLHVVEKQPAAMVAEGFGISAPTVSRIKLGRLWNEATAELRRIHGRK